MDDCIIFFSEVTSHDITSYGDRVVIWVWRMEDLMKFFLHGVGVLCATHLCC